MQCRLFLNVVVGQRAIVFELFARKDQALLVGGDTFLVLNFLLNVIYGIAAFYIQRDGFSGEGF